ncbi:single-stranded DNA-binding protein [Acidithiobacillus thiooxidans]|uniref:Single-stranded DNA-binding protein n=1 Tax=Acidithiobacillus thiooxidans ATCC 19377 TaxID=637390 RepID=A0A543Q6P3_ACITH|nr:single-stranded DNA-binding protein [Acidithiobacillus thiooxidans]MDX5933785.1 single-stranded DNA-binding protein [Acidithiobacillus thiooxidans]TQN51998.1 Single-stranded DNA-binding protein [Acidithiobacillus thiooxidans ATCC 19377]
MLNRVELIGHIGQTPEIRYTQDKKAIANLSVATSESYKDKDGNKQENTEWHRVVAFGKLAEIIGEYCGKGQLIYVAGKIRTRKWTDKEGQERYTTEIVANEMKMLSKKDGTASESHDQQAQPSDFPEDDEIPF